MGTAALKGEVDEIIKGFNTIGDNIEGIRNTAEDVDEVFKEGIDYLLKQKTMDAIKASYPSSSK